jgi:hypothetical protein
LTELKVKLARSWEGDRNSKQLLKDVCDLSKDFYMHKIATVKCFTFWPSCVTRRRRKEGEDKNKGGGGGYDDGDGEREGVEVKEAEEDTNMALNVVCYIIYENL